MSQTSSSQVTRNTLFLYLRMLLSISVSLYTSRVVLQVLGASDYGVYTLVGGVVSMFTFLNTAMSAATSRFLTFEMSGDNPCKLRDTFSSAFIIHCGIALAIVVLAETVGLWWIDNKLVIPAGRMFAAKVVYQCSVISVFFTITQVPYGADIISHEKMDIYAYVELLNVGLKLLIVYLLLLIAADKLITYAIMVLGVTVTINLTYRFYCIRNYEESHLRWVWDKKLLKPMLSFSGWNMMSELGYSFRVQGSNMVLNMFFGTIVNAAAGIASTVQGVLLGLVANVVTAVRPQIIKNYAVKDLHRMNRLMTSSIRLNLLLVVLLTVPMFVSAPYILKLWLGEVPEYCVPFSRLLLFAIFITSVSQIVTIGIQATGNIRQTSLVRNVIYLSTPFVIYLVLKFFSDNPVLGYVIIVISQMTACLTDIYILHRNISEIDTRSILIDYLKSLAIGGSVVYLGMHLPGAVGDSLLPVVRDVFIECLLLATLFMIFMFKKYERETIFRTLRTFLNKILHK